MAIGSKKEKRKKGNEWNWLGALRGGGHVGDWRERKIGDGQEVRVRRKTGIRRH